ncbi:ABC transporter ATP-binding protein [Fimbriiglobus ruber]|uniref:ABC transporter related n=1 Tax=Fimbriiglobus ruber TaxID=1908690 RepID=A0A225DH34_9BACT|nr:ABC transporter ATP-binding protein [Fimbriiglobus ruber]OWK36519.1 ABC transporter related [Fimbriiglobus ruber]
MSDPMIVASDVGKAYGTGPGAVVALAGVTLSVAPGERVAILGKSGSGKSTLMNLLGGLDSPTTGSLAVAGRNLAGLSRRQLADYRLTQVGFIFQSFHLIPSKSSLENVELPLVLAGKPARDRRTSARELLARVGMDHRADHYPTQLSGGERQRVAVARALVNHPAILLADEPTGNLDSATADAVMELLSARVRETGVTLVLVTHDEDLAARTVDRVVRMRDGRVVE